LILIKHNGFAWPYSTSLNPTQYLKLTTTLLTIIIKFIEAKDVLIVRRYITTLYYDIMS